MDNNELGNFLSLQMWNFMVVKYPKIEYYLFSTYLTKICCFRTEICPKCEDEYLYDKYSAEMEFCKIDSWWSGIMCLNPDFWRM
jgi:hypothetical protein